MYDEASEQWQPAAPLPQVLHSPRCTVLNCQGLVCSGYTVDNVLLFTPFSSKSSCRIYRSSATCLTATRGLSRFLYLLIVGIRELSRIKVCSIAILLLIHNATGRAYIFGGNLCQDAQQKNCIGVVSSVEMLDTSRGKWQNFSAPLGRAAWGFQFAMLDHELGAYLRTKRTVNGRFSDECGHSTTDDHIAEHKFHCEGPSRLRTFDLLLGQLRTCSHVRN